VQLCFFYYDYFLKILLLYTSEFGCIESDALGIMMTFVY